MFKRLAWGLALAVGSGSGAVRADVGLGELAGFQIGIEGLLQTDGYWFDNDVADLNGSGSGDGDDSEFGVRRAEVVLKGKRAALDWALGYDFESERFLDTYLRWKRGASALRLGQFKQPLSLEELGSSRHNDFIAKALSTSLFAIGRRQGFGYQYDTASMGAAVTVFGRELTRNQARGSGFGLRGYWLPWQGEQRWLHFGLAYADYDTDGDRLRLSARPGADFASVRLIDTGTLLNTDRRRTLAAELALVQGAWKLQGEYLHGRIDRYPAVGQTAADPTLQAGYLSLLWNLGGETWGVKQGVPQNPQPAAGSGLWQLGLRFDHADLDDAGVLGGKEDNLTLGVNWYWGAHWRLSANLVKVSSERRGIQDDPSITELRAQLHW